MKGCQKIWAGPISPLLDRIQKNSSFFPNHPDFLDPPETFLIIQNFPNNQETFLIIWNFCYYPNTFQTIWNVSIQYGNFTDHLELFRPSGKFSKSSNPCQCNIKGWQGSPFFKGVVSIWALPPPLPPKTGTVEHRHRVLFLSSVI